jgi:hypothetical protein
VEGAISTVLRAPDTFVDRMGAQGRAQPGDYARGMMAREDAVQNWCWYALLPDIQDDNATALRTPSVSMGGGATNSVNEAGQFLYNQVQIASRQLRPVLGLPWYYVQTANLPFREFESDVITRNSHEIHYPTAYKVGQLTLGLFMDSSSITHRYLQAWSSKILGSRNPKRPENQGDWGLPVNYKKDIIISVLSVKKKVLLNVKYINCWPTNLEALALASGVAEPLVQPVSFSVEDVEVTIAEDLKLGAQIKDTLTGYARDAVGGAAKALITKYLG